VRPVCPWVREVGVRGRSWGRGEVSLREESDTCTAVVQKGCHCVLISQGVDALDIKESELHRSFR
jgi:hypothetical protein